MGVTTMECEVKGHDFECSRCTMPDEKHEKRIAELKAELHRMQITNEVSFKVWKEKQDALEKVASEMRDAGMDIPTMEYARKKAVRFVKAVAAFDALVKK